MSRLADFLNKLSCDVELQKAFRDNPLYTMKCEKLRDKEIVAVLSGDLKTIKELIGDVNEPVLILHIDKYK